MRKTAAVFALLAFLLSSVAPLSAQRSTKAGPKGAVTQNGTFETLRAVTEGAGVLIRWTMKSEATAGYNVYRVDGDSRTRVNPRLIAGSVLRYGDRPAEGELREFFDVDGKTGQRYVVEGLTLDGGGFSSSVISAVAVAIIASETGTSSESYRHAAISKDSNIESRSASLTSDLSAIVSQYEREPDPLNQRVVGGKAGAKIAVKQDGFYRVTAAELQAASFPIDSDSTKWRLFTNGVEQSIIVGPGAGYIDFYGRGIDIPDTDTRIYYLIADGVVGKRIGTRTLRAVPGSPVARNFPAVSTKKERTEFNSRLFNGDGENYLGRLFASGVETIGFNLAGVDEGVSEATVKVSFYGLGNQHEVRLKLNGQDLPAATGGARSFFSGEFQVPSSRLVNGTNQLQFQTTQASGVVQFDKIDVEYRRLFTADAGRVSFSSQGNKKLELSGFSTGTVRVFDVTFDGSPVALSGVAVTEAGGGFKVQVPATRSMVGYAVEDSALLSSPSVTANSPSALATGERRTDMLILSPSSQDFRNAAESWAEYRRTAAGGGFRVEVIDIADVYDEFNYGLAGPEGVKKFLQFASAEWAIRPSYLLIMGDGTRDPRNYERRDENGLVPTEIVTLINEESGSDEALGDSDGDGLSEIAIGRIPVRNPAQVPTLLDKTVAYEENQLNFDRGVLFADNSDPEFQAMSQQLAQRLPNGTPVTMVGAGEVNANASLLNAMRKGNFFVNYSGHGAFTRWASPDFFTNSMVPQVTNRNRTSVYSMLTCDSGYFIRPGFASLAEALILSEAGGAVATWASTSQSPSDWQLMMADKYFEIMAEPGQSRVGDLIKEAKLAVEAGPDVRLQWALLGDPALRTP